MATHIGTPGIDILDHSSSGSDDILDGLGGTDLMIGGAGNDSYYVDQFGDQILELSSEGTDTVYAASSYQLGDQIENLVLTGIAGNSAYGNGLDNVITGNSGNNTLVGLDGNDTLNGGLGHDTALYSAASSGYAIGLSGGKFTVKDISTSNGNEGTDILDGIEQVAFSDGALTISRLHNEFRVNTHTANAQGDSSIAMLADGGFIVTWTSDGQDSDDDGVYAQRYDVNGETIGDEFLVNTTTLSNQFDPVVTALADGGFVITWTSFDLDDTGVYGQRYDANGTAQGAEFLINTVETDAQETQSITALQGGGFVVAWTSTNQDGANDGVYAQIYDDDGAPVGIEFLVNSTTASYQYLPNIAALTDGGFVATWTSFGQDGSGTGIYAQRYDEDGNVVGGEFRVNDTTSSDQYSSTVTGLEDGGFVVAWTSNVQDGSLAGIYAQRYDADGIQVGDEFRVNTYTTGAQEEPEIAALADGGFVVIWQSNLQDGSAYGIYAQRYDASGSAAGSEFLVNTYTSGAQQGPAVTALADGGFMVSWSSADQDGDNDGVYAQRYGANGILYGIEGDSGNNTLSFTGGSASLKGGLGNDSYVIDDAGDIVTEAFNAGTDTVRTAVSYTLSANVENIVLTGSTSINATGNNLNNVLTGNAGNNILDGGLGNDTMTGGKGDDTYIVSASGDKVVEAAAGGTDTIITSVSYTLAAQVENLTLVSATGRTLTGNTANNIITGSYGNDTLTGDAGIDTLKGGLGNDKYVIDTATDTLTENVGEGTDTVQSSVTFTLGTNFENLILTGSSALKGKGNSLANALTGNTGANALDGSAGNDTLNGGLGNDSLKGGTGLDNFLFNSTLGTTNIDTISDFSIVDDSIRLENAIFKKLTATGALNTANFKANTSGKAADANDYIVYETDTGKLFYDADGSGKGAAVQFALVGNKAALTFADFEII